MDFFSKEQIKTYILVKEGRNGIETFMDKDIERFNPAYKGMLITFLKKVTKLLEDTENDARDRTKPTKFE